MLRQRSRERGLREDDEQDGVMLEVMTGSRGSPHVLLGRECATDAQEAESWTEDAPGQDQPVGDGGGDPSGEASTPLVVVKPEEGQEAEATTESFEGPSVVELSEAERENKRARKRARRIVGASVHLLAVLLLLSLAIRYVPTTTLKGSSLLRGMDILMTSQLMCWFIMMGLHAGPWCRSTQERQDRVGRVRDMARSPRLRIHVCGADHRETTQPIPQQKGTLSGIDSFTFGSMHEPLNLHPFRTYASCLLQDPCSSSWVPSTR